MLQAEFYERTKVQLTAEQYGEVENIYNRLQMNKDEFCKLWLKNRDNKIISELMTYIMGTEKKLLDLEKKSESFDRLLQNSEKLSKEHLHEFGRKIIARMDDQISLYDVLEEEFSLDFIIKVKLENDTPLENHERKHLIEML